MWTSHPGEKKKRKHREGKKKRREEREFIYIVQTKISFEVMLTEDFKTPFQIQIKEDAEALGVR